jgi:non-homologous end joining protein Ku
VAAAPRSLWKGHLRPSLVTIPIRLGSTLIAPDVSEVALQNVFDEF